MFHHKKYLSAICLSKKINADHSYTNQQHNICRRKVESLKNIALIAVFLVLLLAHAAFIQANAVYAQADSISDSVLRLRVVANSDSEEDQKLKLVFKSRLCEILKPYLSNCPSVGTASDWIQNNLPFIQEQADHILEELHAAGHTDEQTGSSLSSCTAQLMNHTPAGCTVELTDSSFPTRTYGNLTFPPGNYRTLLVTLGNGKGHNWWCVLYPSLCFTDESTASFSEEAQSKLQQTLSEEDYETINQGITYRFRIAELVGDLYKNITSNK